MHKNGFFHRDVKPENMLTKGDVIKVYILVYTYLLLYDCVYTYMARVYTYCMLVYVYGSTLYMLVIILHVYMYVLGRWFRPCSRDPLQAALHWLCLYSLVPRSGGAAKVHPMLHHTLRAYMYKRHSDSSYASYVIQMLICVGRLTTAPPSTSGRAVGWWRSCSSWGLCSQGRARQMRSIRYARC